MDIQEATPNSFAIGVNITCNIGGPSNYSNCSVSKNALVDHIHTSDTTLWLHTLIVV